MNKPILPLMLCVLLSGCLNIGSGFRVPPDASARWKLCNEDKIYPAKKLHRKPAEPSVMKCCGR